MSNQGPPYSGGYGGPPNYGTGGWSAPPPPPPGGSFGYQPQPPANQGSTIAALILNIVMALTCYGSIPALVGIVLSSIALGQLQTQPDSARKLTLGAWICFGISVLIVVGLILFYVLFVVGMVWSSESYSTY